MTPPFLSIIIPAYNEVHRLPTTLSQVCSFLDMQPYSSEIIVVENGSQDHTLEVAIEFAKRHPRLHVIQENKRGKGIAVKRGMLVARGEYRFMCDADLSMPVAEINRFLPPNLTGYDIAIASREAQGAVRYNEPAYRHLVGRLFNTMIRLIALPGLNDTQCGFKCFRAPVAEDLFHRQTLIGWSFDVEVLYIARKRGYEIIELPIPWHFNSDSHVSVLGDSLRMAIDLLSIRLKNIQGLYERPI